MKYFDDDLKILNHNYPVILQHVFGINRRWIK